MRRSLRNYLLFINIALLAACSGLRGYHSAGRKIVTPADVEPVIGAQAGTFKATIKIFNKRYTGLLVFKITGEDTAHIIFVTEIGMKMFDFMVVKDVLQPVFVFQPLDRPDLIGMLRTDLSLITLSGLFARDAERYTHNNLTAYRVKEKNKSLYFVNDRLITRIQLRGPLFVKESVAYSYSKGKSIQQIKVRHKGFFPLKMDLVRINNTD